MRILNHKQRNFRKRRTAKRQREADEDDSHVNDIGRKRAKQSLSNPIIASGYSVAEAPVNSTGTAGLRRRKYDSPRSWKEAQRRGYTYYEVEAGDPARPLVDRQNRKFGLSPSRPVDVKGDDDWNANVICEMERDIAEGVMTLTFSKKEREHKRGDFPATNGGVGFGGGRKV